MALENEPFYRVLDPILDVINREFVQINDDQRKIYVQVALEVIEYVVGQLKERNEVFKELYSRPEYVGSYFDGLRVKAATEFDINLIMKVLLDFNIVALSGNVYPGFVKVNISEVLKNRQQSANVTRTINQWCDHNGYLLETKVREWMEGVITRCFGTNRVSLQTSTGVVEIMFRKAGPAFTLSITMEKSINIDVDLVFTIEFPETAKPPTSVKWDSKIAAPWVILPKQSTNDRFWRISYSNSERKLLHQKYKLKFINRLLKAVRDAETNLKPIPSYQIKNLFLWQAHECMCNDNDRFWEKSQGFLFVYMLNKLWEALNEKRLPYFWDNKMNLFDRFSSSQMLNMANQIKYIVVKINEYIRLNNIGALRNFMFDLFRKQ